MRCRLRRSLQLVAACACVMVYINFFLPFKPEDNSGTVAVDDFLREKRTNELVRTPRPRDTAFNLDLNSSSFASMHNIVNITLITEKTSVKRKMAATKLRVIYPDEEHYTDDRIMSQLQLIPDDMRGNGSVKTKKILVYNGLSGFAVKPGRKTFQEQQCRVQDCELVGDRNQISQADVVLFQSGPAKNLPRPPGQIWALFLLESPYHTMGLNAYTGVFNWTATYRHDSTIVAPYEKFVPYNTSVLTQPQTRNFAAGKTKKVAWFVSNCGARNKRRQYAEELSKFIEVDIYGNCGKLKCPRMKASKCFEMLNNDYKFYLSFENSNCRDYITEKFFVNGLKHDVIPIVMGAAPEDYARSAPPHSFIHVDDFESPKQLAEYLALLDKNDDLFNEYFQWKGTGDIINTYFWCRVCALAHDAPSRGQSWYDNLDSWWRGPEVCIGQKSWREVPRANKLIAPLPNHIPPAKVVGYH